MIEGVAREEKNDSVSNEKVRQIGFHFFKMKTHSHHSLMAHLHMHDAIEMIYMNEGSVRVSADDKEYSLFPGDLTLFRSRGIHCIYSENNDVNNYYVLKFSTQFLSRILPPQAFNKILLRFMSLNSSLKTVWRNERNKKHKDF
jgi:mannose-6-phosphate isomerase-like protein (cupin superfamily)